MHRRILSVIVLLSVSLLFLGCQQTTGPESHQSPEIMAKRTGTIAPGHQGPKFDADGNGIPDEGVVVSGHYTALYAYDANGDWLMDYGDGRPGNPAGTVSSVDALDQATLTVCDYVINYRGRFDNDPYMDAGWIQNHINCQGYDDNGTYNTLVVHETDPRYTGNGIPTWGGSWEYIVSTTAGLGNAIQPHKPVD